MGLAESPGSSATLGRAGSQGTAVRWENGGGVGNVVACHGRDRRTRAGAGEGGHGRAYVGDDSVVAVVVANREVRSVIGKKHHLLGLKGPVQARHMAASMA